MGKSLSKNNTEINGPRNTPDKEQIHVQNSTPFVSLKSLGEDDLLDVNSKENEQANFPGNTPDKIQIPVQDAIRPFVSLKSLGEDDLLGVNSRENVKSNLFTVKKNQDINILLLGETGVGKSTFINSIANYLHFKSFKKAAKAEELLVLIPSLITVTDENFEQISITIGSDNNEFQKVGDAGTQDVKTYVFPIGEGKTRLRLIDSPGMGDPRGIEQDDINCENILAYLSQLKELHAICYLMKPITTRKTVYFEYCVRQILSRLEKSASKNIIFIFTNTRGTDYSPGDTLPILQKVVDEIKAKPPHVAIPLEKKNIFSFDNEAFRILVAMKKNVNFSDQVKERFVESWNKSSQECWRLISYIIGDASNSPLTPHQLHNTISINEARRLIVQLSQPLADISQLIYDNIRILDRHKFNLKMENQSLDDLKKKMYIPVINLQITQLTQPATVCTSAKCAEVVQVDDRNKWHYPQRCHDPCYLNNIKKEIIGDPGLINCAAMNGATTCTKCTCDFRIHMHIYYMTKTIDDKIVDNTVRDNILHKEAALREAQRLIGEIEKRKKELEDERDIITQSTAQFAHFLQHNAISPFNDSYKGYIEYLILREKSMGRNGDLAAIVNLEQLLRQYEEIKRAFDNSLNLNQQLSLNGIIPTTVTAQSVINSIHKLYQLKHNGKKIHEIMKKQKISRNAEHDKTCEYIHPKSAVKSDKPNKDKKHSNHSDDDKTESKKFSSKTDDERKRNNKNKGKYKSHTDDERKDNFKGHNFQKPNTSRNNQQQKQHLRNFEPPPPYPGNETIQHQRFSSKKSISNEPDVVLKVELTNPSKHKEQPNDEVPYSSYQPYPPGTPYYGHPQGPYQHPYYGGPPPPPLLQGPFSQQPPQGHYPPAPPGPYLPPPDHYYGQYFQGPHQGPPHGPPQGQYPGQYYPPPPAPPQGSHNQGQHQGHFNKSGTANRGRPHQKRGGGRGRNFRYRNNNKDKKSGSEKSGVSSNSDSSSE